MSVTFLPEFHFEAMVSMCEYLADEYDGYDRKGGKHPSPGKVAGYRTHLRRKEPPCDDCRAAYVLYKRDLRRRQRCARASGSVRAARAEPR